MTKHTILRAAAATLLLTLALSACNGSIQFGDGIKGSGELVTTQFDVDNFDSIEVEDTYEAFITVGEQRSVEVLANSNVVEELDVRVRNGTLIVGLRDGGSLSSGTLEATISVPELVDLDVSGASEVTVDGSSGSDQHFDISGASELKATNVSGEVTVDASGSSDVEMQGTATRVIVDSSGSSDLIFEFDGLERATIDLSGASSVEFDSVGVVTGSISGASDLTVPAAADVNVESTGSSDVNRS